MKRPSFPPFGRSDLVLLKALLLGGVALSVIGWLVAPVVGWVRGTDLAVPYEGPAQVAQLSGTGIAVADATYDLRLPDPSPAQRLVDLAPGLVGVVVVAWASLLVLRLVATVAAGDPFARVNVARLRWLAGLLLGGWIVLSAVRGIATMVVLEGVDDLGGLDPQGSVTLQGWPLVLGLLVALLAEAFAVGSRLREDVEGLV